MNDFIIWIAGTIFSIFGAVVSWFIGRIFKSIDEIEVRCDVISESVAAHKLHSAETYTTKKDVKDMKDEVVQHLIRIEQKVDEHRNIVREAETRK